MRQDALHRIPIGGTFGQGKRWFGLASLMTKLSYTCQINTVLSFLAMEPAK